MKCCKVQFKQLGKRYYFGCSKLELHDKDKVVVQTVRGVELGEVVGESFELTKDQASNEIKDVLRKANLNDIKTFEENKSLEPDILSKTKFFAKKHNLDMKVLGCEYTLDRQKLIIYFESEGRVDFRDLVRDLADSYKTRIELRQVGSRDGAKVFGGIGPCGLIVCCQTFLTEFVNVSVKMAKNQSLSLNPVKISGNCGKLLCCINYENDTYLELRRSAPDIGDIVSTEQGDAKVLTCDVLNRNLKVKYLQTEGFGYLKFDDVKLVRTRRDYNKEKDNDNSSELKELE